MAKFILVCFLSLFAFNANAEQISKEMLLGYVDDINFIEKKVKKARIVGAQRDSGFDYPALLRDLRLLKAGLVSYQSYPGQMIYDVQPISGGYGVPSTDEEFRTLHLVVNEISALQKKVLKLPKKSFFINRTGNRVRFDSMLFASELLMVSVALSFGDAIDERRVNG